MHSPDQLVDEFRAQGRKITPQRRAVFGALFGDKEHPTADTIHRRVCETMPSVSLRTVYQVLNDLVEMDEVHAVVIDDGPVRFDPNSSPHQHFVCRVCGAIADVQASGVSALAGGDASGYEVEATEVVFRGRCPECITSSPNRNT